MAIEALPYNCHVSIYTDSQAAISIISKWKNTHLKPSTRSILKTTGWQVWNNIITTIKQKNIKLIFKKIKAYTGNIFNEKVNKLAKLACHKPAIIINSPNKSHINFSAYCEEYRIDSNL